MHALIAVNGRTVWQEELKEARTVSMGSGPTAEVRLTGPTVLPNHVELSFEGQNGWFCAHGPIIVGRQPVIGWVPMGQTLHLGVAGFEVMVRLSAEPMGAPRAPAEAPAHPAATAKAPPGRSGLTSIFGEEERANLRRVVEAKKKTGSFFSREQSSTPRLAAATPPAKGAIAAKVKAQEKKPAPPPRPAVAKKGFSLFRRRTGQAKEGPAAAPPAAVSTTSAAAPAGTPAPPPGDHPTELARLFALPASDAARPGAPTRQLGQRRLLGLALKTWLTIVVSGTAGFITLATRQVPPASAGRTLGIQLLPSPPNVGASQRSPKKLEEVTPAKIQEAAAALIAGDITTALKLYQRLAESDASFAPFAQAIKRRINANCNDPAARRDPC